MEIIKECSNIKQINRMISGKVNWTNHLNWSIGLLQDVSTVNLDVPLRSIKGGGTIELDKKITSLGEIITIEENVPIGALEGLGRPWDIPSTSDKYKLRVDMDCTWCTKLFVWISPENLSEALWRDKGCTVLAWCAHMVYLGFSKRLRVIQWSCRYFLLGSVQYFCAYWTDMAQKCRWISKDQRKSCRAIIVAKNHLKQDDGAANGSKPLVRPVHFSIVCSH